MQQDLGQSETVILPDLGRTETAFSGKWHQRAPEDDKHVPGKGRGSSMDKADVERAGSLWVAVES